MFGVVVPCLCGLAMRCLRDESCRCALLCGWGVAGGGHGSAAEAAGDGDGIAALDGDAWVLASWRVPHQVVGHEAASQSTHSVLPFHLRSSLMGLPHPLHVTGVTDVTLAAGKRGAAGKSGLKPSTSIPWWGMSI